jgi:hypothetical protein
VSQTTSSTNFVCVNIFTRPRGPITDLLDRIYFSHKREMMYNFLFSDSSK